MRYAEIVTVLFSIVSISLLSVYHTARQLSTQVKWELLAYHFPESYVFIHMLGIKSLYNTVTRSRPDQTSPIHGRVVQLLLGLYHGKRARYNSIENKYGIAKSLACTVDGTAKKNVSRNKLLDLMKTEFQKQKFKNLYSTLFYSILSTVSMM